MTRNMMVKAKNFWNLYFFANAEKPKTEYIIRRNEFPIVILPNAIQKLLISFEGEVNHKFYCL